MEDGHDILFAITIKKARKKDGHFPEGTQQKIKNIQERLDLSNANKLNPFKYVLRYKQGSEPDVLEYLQQIALIKAVKLDFGDISVQDDQFNDIFTDSEQEE